jgi:hypothetical protein
MLLSNVNLEKQLLSLRDKTMRQDAILQEVQLLLTENQDKRNKISENIKRGTNEDENDFNFDLLETNKIFHIHQIKTICVDYRLRFLDSSLFKNTIPEEAITKIDYIQKQHNTTLAGFKIMAPSKAFHLVNYDDPMLFAPIGNGYYYLLHKWGDEFNTTRKWLVSPIKNLTNFTVFSIIISILLTLIIPISNLGKTIPMAKIIVFLFVFKSIIAVFLYYFFMLGKNFNSEIWQRKYYNN